MIFNWSKRKREAAGETPLAPCPPPAERGPEAGTDVPDLRAVLLELAGRRARLRQDRSLFQREDERFCSELGPLPGWLAAMYNLTPPRRLEIALHWAKRLDLIEASKEGRANWLDLSEPGRRWLTLRAEGQYEFIFEALRGPARPKASHYSRGGDFHDSGFLGTPAAVSGGEWSESPEYRPALREALYAAFAALPVGAFYRFDDFAAHTASGPHNPLLLGRRPKEVRVWLAGRLVVPPEKKLGEAARHVLGQMVSNRLIPLGGLQAGRDADGELLIARRPRLDRYFGHDAPADVPEAGEAGRVVVQPDFTVILIGACPEAAAELAPFGERDGDAGEGGAVTRRITRAAVLRAVTAGLSAAEILDRLRRHGSTPVPGNVAHEIAEWAGCVRVVTAAPATVFQCPDAAAADRVAAALGRAARRLNETTVAYPPTALADAERRRLQEQGIVIGPSPHD